MENMIVRHGPPSNVLDIAPKDTYCRVYHRNSFDLYIQTSPNEEEPCWQFVDCFPIDSPQIEDEILPD
jgi:hypothetical protein